MQKIFISIAFQELRTELQMKKLQHVIDVQESERNNYSEFNRCCLFCRTNFQVKNLTTNERS